MKIAPRPEQGPRGQTDFITAFDRDALSVLRGGSSTPRLVMLHPAGGTAGGFRRLVPAIAAPREVVAFEVFEPGPEHRCSVEAIATDYVAELLATYPSCGRSAGLSLIGWSFGGLVALEMAGLLEESGRDLDHVVLLDSGTPAALAARGGTTAQNIAAMLGFPIDAVAPNATVSELLERLGSPELVPSAASATPLDLTPFVETYLWHLAAMRTPWTPRPVRTSVTLVRAASEHGWAKSTSEDLGWSELLGRDVPVLWTAGDHYAMTDSAHIPVLAEILATILPLTLATSFGEPTATPDASV